MRLIFSSDDFRYASRPRPGIPIILGDDMHPFQPFQDFLIWKLLGKGQVLKPLTWEDYGRRLWDFVMFLYSNKLAWDNLTIVPGQGNFAKYRDWSMLDLGLNPKTINGRLRLVREFYEWANKRGLIDGLPFTYADTRPVRVEGRLEHIDQPDGAGRKTEQELREWASMPEFLTIDELRAIRSQNLSPSQSILFELMVRVGLRSCEARTFPLKYVFNPATRIACVPEKMIRINLNPKDMLIKFDKAREVDIPYSLMQQMHAYTMYERNRLTQASEKTQTQLILTVGGRAFSKDAVGQMLRGVAKKVGFRVAALMLRHSYAVHTLRKLRQQKDFEGEPLLYVRDRLGHEDVETTVIYLRQIEKLAGGLMLAMEDEFDRLFETTP